MNRIFVFILFICLSTISIAQEIFRIDFHPETSADFDIHIKAAIESTGAIAFINYFDRNIERPFNTLVKYEEVGKTLYIKAYDENDKFFFIGEKRVNNNKAAKASYWLVSELLNKEINYDKSMDNRYHAINANEIEKIDTATYVITTKGSAASTVESIQDNFLDIAKSLTTSFETYFQNTKYQYQTQSGIYTFQHVGKKTIGIVIGSKLENENYIILDEPPAIYKKYNNDLSDHLMLPEGDFTDSENSLLFIFRDTGYNGSFKNFSVFVDEKFVCKIGNKEYITLDISPGNHSVVVQPGGSKIKSSAMPIEIEVTKEKDIYLNTLNGDGYGSSISCIEVEKHEAKLLSQNLKKGLDCK